VLRVGPIRWVASHTAYVKDRLFVDEQVEGPFASWVHRHEFEDLGGRTRLTDRVEYRLPGGAVVNAVGRWFVGAGLAGMHRLRVLLCDGPRLLAWVGVFRGEPFGREERETLAALVPLLRDRLLLEELLDESWLQREAFRASLDALEGPAFLFTRAGEVRQANAAGQAALDRDPAVVKRELLRSLGGENDALYHVTEVARRGNLSHFLGVRRVTMDGVAGRLEVAARQWSLTRRQGEVLALIARGLNNRGISDRLGCTEGTVALHVSAVLQKAAVEGRAELTARFWMLGLEG
jgi:DNA-binding CsgD family transcriptional regulator